MPDIPEVKDGFKIRMDSCVGDRRATSVSLGCHVLGAANPKCDPNDPYTKAAGALYRIGRKPPKMSRTLKYAFINFVRHWILQNLVPLTVDDDTSFETWLEQIDQPQSRKDDLRNQYSEFAGDWKDRLVTQVKAFIKDETYPSFKHARWIMSRSDTWKCLYGPIIRLIEQRLYQLPYFVKHMNDDERALHIQGLARVGATYLVTDYTSYESHFTPELMKACEFQLYDHMTSGLENHDEFMAMNFGVIAGKNRIASMNLNFSMPAGRMSGEMSTSLANGFTNLMVMLFLAHRHRCTDVSGVVEGDDGLFTMVGEPPTKEEFKEMGFTIKLEKFTDFSEASFCGLVYDADNGVRTTDPCKVLLNFGWTHRQYLGSSDEVLHALVRAKALSFGVQYPGCPIIQALAQFGLRHTGKVRFFKMLKAVNRLSMYDRERLKRTLSAHIVPQDIQPSTRLLVERRFNVDMEQQRSVESYLENAKFVPMNIPSVLEFAPDVALEYFDGYVYKEARDPNWCPIQYSRTLNDMGNLLQRLTSLKSSGVPSPC